MNPQQFSIWTEEELDVFAPKKKTKMELNREKKELFEKKLVERIILSEEEIKKHAFSLNKQNLIDYFNKNEWDIGKDYYMNKGVPQKLLNSLAEYSKKEQKDLLVSDLIVLYKSINFIFLEKLGNTEFTKFRKANDLSSFGISQYFFMEKFIEDLI